MNHHVHQQPVDGLCVVIVRSSKVEQEQSLPTEVGYSLQSPVPLRVYSQACNCQTLLESVVVLVVALYMMAALATYMCVAHTVICISCIGHGSCKLSWLVSATAVWWCPGH